MFLGTRKDDQDQPNICRSKAHNSQLCVLKKHLCQNKQIFLVILTNYSFPFHPVCQKVQNSIKQPVFIPKNNS